MKLFITRPEIDGLKTAEKLKKLGHVVAMFPIIKIEFVKGHNIKKADALIFTSKNGVRSIGNMDIDKGILIFTIGKQTAIEAKKLGFKRVFSANGSQNTLLDLILLHGSSPKGSFVHLSGEHIKDDLVGILNSKNLRAERQITYKAIALKKMPSKLIEAIKSKELDGGIFYSIRSANIFKDMVEKNHLNEDTKNLTAFVLSENIKDSLNKEEWKNIIVAPNPNETSLINQIESFVQTIK